MQSVRILGVVAISALYIHFYSPRLAKAERCANLGAAPVVFVENGDTQEPLLKRLGFRLIRSANPVRIAYKNRRTCDLASDMLDAPSSTPTIANDALPIRYIPTPAEQPTWTPSSPAPSCEADPQGNPLALAIGATFLSSCGRPDPAADSSSAIAQYTGPIQAYGFVTARASSQVAITAEEAYFALGFASATGQAAPWTDQNVRFTRGPTSSTALTLAAAIGLRASQLKGTTPPGNSSQEVLSRVNTTPNPDATLGLLGTEIYDSARSDVKLLAFRGFGQRYAYFPDSTATSFDKRNVRDGHYLPWSPTTYLTRVDRQGNPVDVHVQRILRLIFGATHWLHDANSSQQPPSSDLTNADALVDVIASGLIPTCAMRVTRATEGGPLSRFAPSDPCDCFFEAHTPGGTQTCASCNKDSDCATGRCRRNMCEAD